MSGEDLPPGGLSFCCSLTWPRRLGALQGHESHAWRLYPQDLNTSWPAILPRNTITLVVRISTREFGRDTNIQTITALFTNEKTEPQQERLTKNCINSFKPFDVLELVSPKEKRRARKRSKGLFNSASSCWIFQNPSLAGIPSIGHVQLLLLTKVWLIWRIQQVKGNSRVLIPGVSSTHSLGGELFLFVWIYFIDKLRQIGKIMCTGCSLLLSDHNQNKHIDTKK